MKNLVISIIFNFSLFILLMVGIQNSSNKRKVNLLINETVRFTNKLHYWFKFYYGILNRQSFISKSFK